LERHASVPTSAEAALAMGQRQPASIQTSARRIPERIAWIVSVSEEPADRSTRRGSSRIHPSPSVR
jgi:hypothetical protein